MVPILRGAIQYHLGEVPSPGGRGEILRERRYQVADPHPFGDAELRAPRAGVPIHFGGAGANWFPGKHLQPRVVAKRLFHPAILQRVKTDDRQPGPGAKAIGQPPQGNLQRLQLVVDRDPQGLEGPRGRIDPLQPRPRHAAADQFGQLGRRLDGLLPPLLDDRPGDPAAVSLLAVVVNQVGQVLGAEAIDQPPGRLAPHRVEPQVQRPGRGEAESPLRVGQLVARRAPGPARCRRPARSPVRASTSGRSQKLAWTGLTGSSARLALAAATAAGSRSKAMTRPSLPTRSARARLWPPPPKVPSTTMPPSRGESHWTTSSNKTGTWTDADSAMKVQSGESEKNQGNGTQRSLEDSTRRSPRGIPERRV